MIGPMICVEVVPQRMVYPSLGALETNSAPIEPLAPIQLSITTARFNVVDNFEEMTRAATSVALPA